MELKKGMGASRRWGDREFMWGMLALTALLVWAANVLAPDMPTGSRHRDAATVVAGKESGSDVEREVPPVNDRMIDD